MRLYTLIYISWSLQVKFSKWTYEWLIYEIKYDKSRNAENFAEISAAGIFKSIKILYKKCLKMSPLKFDELHYYVLCELYWAKNVLFDINIEQLHKSRAFTR